MQLEKEIDSFSAFSNTASAEQLSTQQKSLTGLASVTQLMATFIQLVGKIMKNL
ncbi:invasin ipaB domain protein [Shigella flexneri K-227]|uniref:Invasin ipaB domain protein n=1 Tax=Shigella flexneri K-227 TaxID=766147 RepID=F5P4G3_SHIFL|nr:invasin ipaB domain protein [Shigella flexneri K-227]EGK31266.1 invasin ipaB domain protein [Shigella flexneri K-227]